MGFREMQDEEMAHLLVEQRIVRIAFDALGRRYLIPLGYVWIDGCLCGNTIRGRKTEMAKTNAQVSSQIDNSTVTGPWGWRSITGEGTFELIGDPTEIARVSPLLQARFSDGPEWFLKGKMKKAEVGEAVFWRIRPWEMTGLEHVPDE